MPRFFRLFFFLFLACAFQLTAAQTTAVDVISHQPSPEAYDLLRDSKGYLWVGHDLGVCRYDGSSFISLHHPLQNSLSMTDLIEDKKGRIWCHNFSGQIFYIENLQLHLFTPYRFKEEQFYPRLTICGDELVATSAKGLFVHNLTSGKSAYHAIPDGTTSLTRVGDRVVCFGGTGFYCYRAGKPLVKLAADFTLPPSQLINIQNASLKDTFFLITNPSGIYYTLVLKGQRLKLHSVRKLPFFINTITVHDEKVWVNTKAFSYQIGGKDTIRGLNLSNIITDNQGNRWMTSLKAGLCVQYNSPYLQEVKTSLLIPGDMVRKIHREDSTVYLGTANGKLYTLSPSSGLTYLSSIPQRSGAIERMESIGQGQILLGASAGSFVYNTKTNDLKRLLPPVTVKDAVVDGDNLYLATVTGIKRFSLQDLQNSPGPWIAEDLFHKSIRCRSVTMVNGRLFAVFNDGVFMMHGDSAIQLLYKGHPIYASKVRNSHGKLLIGTFNEGLLVFENGTMKNISAGDGLADNSVRDMKIMDNAVWLIFTDRFQRLNDTECGVEDYTFPHSKIDGINDFAVLGQQIYIATTNAVFGMPISRPTTDRGRATYIDRILVNGRQTPQVSELAHNQNFLQFQVSTPYFSPYSHILYQYRIKNAPDSAWQRGASGQTAFTIAALEPGSYDFEVVATDENRRIVSSPAEYHFEILPPWYQRLVVKIGLGIVVAGTAFYLVWLYYRRRLRKQRQEYEKLLLIQAERQRISSEIHDDVGAGLSAVRLLTELTRNKLPDTEARQEVGKIHASLSELSYKMREVIWSLNADNDNLENLLHYIRRQARQLFENSPIDLLITFPVQDIPDVVISGEKRRHIYLAVKEALHNSLKHSEATTCELSIRIESRLLQITVMDDGKGFVPLKKGTAGNGLNNMKKRIQEMNGQLEILSQEKTAITFRIPLTEKHA